MPFLKNKRKKARLLPKCKRHRVNTSQVKRLSVVGTGLTHRVIRGGIVEDWVIAKPVDKVRQRTCKKCLRSRTTRVSVNLTL